jgi:hypothetical protein
MHTYWERWPDVRTGDVVLDATGTPRMIHALLPILGGDGFTVYAEGWPAPVIVQNEHSCQLAILDPADAIGTLHTAGFTVTLIEGN